MAAHEPDLDHEHDDENQPHIASRNARYGLMLFGVYVLLYGGFVGLSAFQPAVMARPALAGVSLALIYGLGLILAALALALVYMALCRLPGR